MMTMTPVRASAFLALLVITGCTPNRSAAQFLDSAGLQAEYRLEIGQLQLPAGYTFPVRAPEGGADRFEAGVGQGVADFYWMCAWIDGWLVTESSDPPTAADALRRLDSAKELSVWRHWDDAGRQALLGAVASARNRHRDGMTRLEQGLGCAGMAN